MPRSAKGVGTSENRRTRRWKDELAQPCPYGKQRGLEIARALATNPKLLLLDEPAAGMNPQETLELTAFIRSIRDRFGLTIFLIEHHMNLVMDISDRIYVIDFGKTDRGRRSGRDSKTIRASSTRIWVERGCVTFWKSKI